MRQPMQQGQAAPRRARPGDLQPFETSDAGAEVSHGARFRGAHATLTYCAAAAADDLQGRRAARRRRPRRQRRAARPDGCLNAAARRQRAGLCVPRGRTDAGTKGNLVADAYLAAMAIEAGCEWVTTDRDLSRFRGPRWRHPLQRPGRLGERQFGGCAGRGRGGVPRRTLSIMLAARGTTRQSHPGTTPARRQPASPCHQTDASHCCARRSPSAASSDAAASSARRVVTRSPRRRAAARPEGSPVRAALPLSS